MRERDEARGQIVIRRVGGLEDQKTYLHPPQFVIRRVGGLEVQRPDADGALPVIRRVGGLEDTKKATHTHVTLSAV